MKKITILLLLTLSLFGSQKAVSQEAFIGEIRMFAGNFAPRDWAFCDGQLLSIAQNTALFSLLGTTYGGDGVSTFRLPDLRGRVAMHPGSGPGLTPRTQGEIGGSETNTLTVAQMPPHNHTVNASTADGDQNIPTNTIPGNTKALDKEYVSTGANTTMSPSMIGVTGQGQPVNNIQPYGTVNYIICLYGIYPSRP